MLSYSINLKNAQKRIAEMQANLKNDEKGMAKISILCWRDIMDHFSKQTGPTSPWEGLKSRQGQILQDTGRLRGGIQATVKDTHAVEIASSVGYGKYHQYGTSKIPERKFLWITEKVIEKIKQTYLEYIIGA